MSRAGNTIVIAASIIAAVRLAREDDLKSSPRVVSKIADSVRLAHEIYQRVLRDYPHLFPPEK